MSYLGDKIACRDCGDLYDPDMLHDGVCRDCQSYDPYDHMDHDEIEHDEIEEDFG